jgi:hypothetical protein
MEQEQKNLMLARDIMGKQGYRSPWGDDREMRQFRAETDSALSDGTERFRIKPVSARSAPVPRGLFAGLFGRS